MSDGTRPSDESIARGKILYENREEYPLPKVEGEGVADYIFYYGPNKNYRKAARRFLEPIYPNHQRVSVTALSDIIDRLHTDIANGTVQRPREIVIVGHASPHVMLLPVMVSPPAALASTFQSVNALSLFELQKAVRAGGNQALQTFESRRKAVARRLTEESFVTFRGCRFGQNKPGLFALFSFFGGRANVYAPRTYMFFATMSVGDGQRFESAADVYEHMAAQRLVKPRSRSPGRQLSVINMVSEPGYASDDADVRSTDLTQESGDRTQYLADIDSLNAGTVPQSVRAELQSAFNVTLDQPVVSLGHEEEEEQRLNGSGTGSLTTWRFREQLSTEFDVFEGELNYKPSEVFQLEILVHDSRFQADTEHGELITSTRVIEREKPLRRGQKQRSNPKVHFQLFLEDHDHDREKGIIDDLAARSTDQPSAVELAAFDAIEGALDTLSAGPSNDAAALIAQAVNDHTRLSADTATLSVQSTTANPKTWRLTLEDKDYAVLKTTESHGSGRRETKLRIAEILGGKDSPKRKAHEAEVIADTGWGTNPDVPGVELMAYLDRLSVDQLKDLIDFLDSVHDTRRVEFGHTWRHAADALDDKHPSRGVLSANLNTNDPLFGLTDPYFPDYNYDSKIGHFLSRSSASYEFPSRHHWRQAREIHLLSPPPQEDLFTERDLPTPPAYFGTVDLDPDPDSPAFEGADLSPREREILETFAGTQKLAFDPVVTLPEDECTTFRRWLGELSRLSGLTDAELDAALAALPDIERPQEGSALGLAISLSSTLGSFLERPGVTERVAVKLSERFPRVASFRLAGLNPRQLAGAASLLGTIYFVGSYFLLNYLADVSEAANSVRQAGANYAFRAYARRLRIIAHVNSGNFPENLNIDILPAPSVDVGLHAIKVAQNLDGYSGGTHFNDLYFGDKDFFGEGFKLGAQLADKAAKQTLADAKSIFNRGLRRAGLQRCMIDALEDFGILDPSQVRAAVMRELADELDRTGRPSSRRE